MNTTGGMVNLLRGLLDDPQDESVPLVVKLSYAAAGIDWLFPEVWTTQATVDRLDDLAVQLTDNGDTTIGDDWELFRVLKGTVSGQAVPWDGFEILVNGVTRWLDVRDSTVVDGSYEVTCHWVRPYVVNEGVGAMENVPNPCPLAAGFLAAVYYAMSLATASPLDKRLDYTRYSTASQNGVGINEIVGVSQFWLDRAEREKERISKPFPPVLF